MTFFKSRLVVALKYVTTGLLLISGLAFAQTQSSVGRFFVSVTLNGVAPIFPASTTSPPVAGACITQTLFDQLGAVVRVTCIDNPFVNIVPSIGGQFPGTFGSTFRYPLFSNPGSFNLATAGFKSLSSLPSGLNSVGASSLSGDNSTLTTSNAQRPPVGSVSSRNFNSPTSMVTDMSIYRTAPQATTDAQGAMDMVISF